MSESKTIHIVFQVINFLHSESSTPLKLSDSEKLLLITLASHKGIKGICPSIKTIARELKKGESSVFRLLAKLKKKGVILIEGQPGKANHYIILTPLTDERGTPLDPSHVREVTPLTDERGTPLTGERIRTNKNNKGITERARTQRAPLPSSWKPDQKRMDLAHQTSISSGKSSDQLLTKFRNLQISKGSTSAYWDGEFENFLINETPAGWLDKKAEVTVPHAAYREWGPGHPDYDSRNKPTGKQGALTNDTTISRNNSGRTNSS